MYLIRKEHIDAEFFFNGVLKKAKDLTQKDLKKLFELKCELVVEVKEKEKGNDNKAKCS